MTLGGERRMLGQATSWSRGGLVLALVAVLAGCSTQPAVSQSPIESATGSPLVSPSFETATPTGQTPSAPTATTAPDAWVPAGSIPEEGSLVAVAAGPGGYALLEGPHTVFFSTDGMAWQRVELPFKATTTSDGEVLDAHADAIAWNGSAFLVVGGYRHAPCGPSVGDGGPDPCGNSPIAWASPDGRHWTSSVGTALPKDARVRVFNGELASTWWDGRDWLRQSSNGSRSNRWPWRSCARQTGSDGPRW